MNITLLSQIYGYQPGFIYHYMGDVPNNEDLYAFVTNAFVVAAGNNLITTNVIDLGDEGIVVHSPHEITSNNFTLVGSVQERPIPFQAPVVEEEAEESEESEEQTQQGGE